MKIRVLYVNEHFSLSIANWLPVVGWPFNNQLEVIEKSAIMHKTEFGKTKVSYILEFC